MDCGHGSQEEGERAMLMKIDMSTVWINFPSQKAQHRERWVSEREREGGCDIWKWEKRTGILIRRNINLGNENVLFERDDARDAIKLYDSFRASFSLTFLRKWRWCSTGAMFCWLMNPRDNAHTQRPARETRSSECKQQHETPTGNNTTKRQNQESEMRDGMVNIWHSTSTETRSSRRWWWWFSEYYFFISFYPWQIFQMLQTR